MNKNRVFIILTTLTTLCFSLATQARDDANMYSVADALNTGQAKEKLNQNYQFKFGSQSHSAITTNYGEFMSNKKTNAFGKSDEAACQWAFLSAMLSFQSQIAKQGGNAVVNIRSYYKKHEVNSATEFECGNGAIMAGVTFKGKVVKLAN